MQEFKQAAYNGSPSSRAAPNSSKVEIPAAKSIPLVLNLVISWFSFYVCLIALNGCS